MEEEPDPRVLWRWVGDAVRPWLGWALIAVGALMMLLGYLGVSREALPAKQIPYLVSGGIGGMFLAVLGAYFLGVQQLRNDSHRLDRLETMVEELHRVLLHRADAPDLTVPSGAGNGATVLRRVVVVDGGDLFHRPDCALVRDKQVEELSPSAARKRGLRDCAVCAPVPASASVA